MTKSFKNKLKSALCITAVTTLGLHCINQLIFSLSVRKNRLNSGSGSFYKWRFGNIYYKKQGQGTPLLLIHDLNPAASAYEWNRTVRKLAENHTVYTIDLIGCGRSDKPKFTYTNYLYVQMISDFINHVIGHKTDVAVTGLSSTFVIMACNARPELFGRILLINPVKLSILHKIPNKRTKALKFLLEAPIIGTLIYNMCTSSHKIKQLFYGVYFSNRRKCSSKNIAAYHEAAHLGKSNAKFLFSSLRGRFVNINIAHAIKQINNTIILICGTDVKHVEEIMNEYTELNPSIEKDIIPNTAYLPQLEDPAAVVSQINIYLQS